MVVEEDERTEGEVAVGGVSPAMSFFWRRLCTGKGQRAPNVLSGCCTSKASFCNHICSCLLSEPPPPQKKTKNAPPPIHAFRFDGGRNRKTSENVGIK